MLLTKALYLFACVVGTEAANICGKVGLHNASKLSFYMGNFFYKGPTTFALCASYCKQDAAKCKSFRYSYWADAASQYCEFFEDGLEGNFTEDTTQPYWYYDIGCAFPAYAIVSTSAVTVQGASVAIRTQTQTQTQTITTTSFAPVVTQSQTITTTSIPPPSTVFVTTTLIQTIVGQRAVVQTISRTMTSTLSKIFLSTVTVGRISTITRTATITSTLQAVAAATRTITSTVTRQGAGTPFVLTTTRTVTVRG